MTRNFMALPMPTEVFKLTSRIPDGGGGGNGQRRSDLSSAGDLYVAGSDAGAADGDGSFGTEVRAGKGDRFDRSGLPACRTNPHQNGSRA